MSTNLKCPRCSVPHRKQVLLPLRVEQKREKGWQENSVNYRFLQEGFFERKEVNHWHTHPNLARITAEL